jgi:hypothetical protein
VRPVEGGGAQGGSHRGRSRRRGLDEIWHGGRVSALGTVSTSSPECKGALGLMVGCSREKEWRGRSTPFCGRVGLRKKRGGDGGGPVRVAPRGGRRREGSGSVAPRGGGQCGGAWRRQRCTAGGGGRRLSSANEAGDERGGGPVGWPWLGHCHEPAHAHNAAFDLKQISN